MSVTKGEAPKTISTELPFSGFAEKFTLKVTYNNITSKQYRDLVDAGKTTAELVFALVAKWDAGYPLSVDGIADFEDERPGVCDGLIQGYWRARRVDLEKTEIGGRSAVLAGSDRRAVSRHRAQSETLQAA